MKKLICLCLTLLVLGALCIAASATGTERAILASGEKVQQGKPIAFSVTLADCGEVSGYTVELVYDAAIFELNGATWQPSDKPFGMDSNIATFTLDAPAVPGNSPILSFTLLAKEDAPLDTVSEVTCAITLHTEAGDIPVTVQSVNVTVTCPHKFEKNLTSEFLITPATCTEPAQYYKSCALCGAIDENQTFLSGTALSHNFKDREMSEYLAEAGDCQNRDIYFVSCAACGLRGEQTFEGRTLGQHVFDSDCDAKCNVCFTQREVSHQVSTEWLSNEKGHWHSCALCDEKVDYTKHNPGAPATPEVPQTCTDCGFVLSIHEDHVHDFGQDWYTDLNSHWQTCACGESSEPEYHPWDTTNPALYVCPVCGASKAMPVQSTTPTDGNSNSGAVNQTQDTNLLLSALIMGIALLLSLIGNVVLLLLLFKKKNRKNPKTPAAEVTE